MGVHVGDRQVASANAFPRRGRALGRYGRALPRALSQPRRQVDHLRVSLRSVQHGAQRAERRYRLHPRRAYFADHEFVQPLCAVRRQSGIHGACAQLPRIDGIRQRISAGEFVRYGRRRFTGCARWRRLDQTDGTSRPKEDCRHGRQLWRLSQHDVSHESARRVGRGCAHRAVCELVH